MAAAGMAQRHGLHRTSKLFPEYAAYAARVSRLLPRVRAESAAGARFRFSLYLRNREYQALAAGLAAAALLLFKLPG